MQDHRVSKKKRENPGERKVSLHPFHKLSD